jgi:hypothetical protein
MSLSECGFENVQREPSHYILCTGTTCLFWSSLQSRISVQRLTAKLLLALASTAIIGFESHGTHDHILLSDGSGSLQTTSLCHLSAKFGRSVKLLLVLASTVILGFEPRQDP